MRLYHQQAYILFVLLALLQPIHSDALNPTQCLADVISCATNPSSQDCVSTVNISNTTAFSVLRTSKGSPIPILPNSTDAANAISYTGCVDYCGTGRAPFSWNIFSQEFSAWLLPYLALLSQLPFGARRRMDNLMSVALTLGSPILAGYSLFMTLLNARWANDQLFARIDYPSAVVRQSVVRALSSLQQVPLRVHPGKSARFESLVVHPDNDNWWTTLAAELDYSHPWSVASATSITWVVITYLLTVADSVSNVEVNVDSTGQGTGSVWLCLLPIVAGWLVLSPKCDYTRVHNAYDKANRQVIAADSSDPTAAPAHVVSNFGLTISPNPDWELHEGDITSPDELQISPVFNYARTLSWARTTYVTSLYYRAAWRKLNNRVGVDGERIPGNVHNHVPPESRLGSRDQIIDYCRPDRHKWPGVNVVWPRGVIFNMIVASLVSLQLQWGTIGAAIVADWFTPAVGLGCRSLAYLIYGALSTTVWILLVSSSVLGYVGHPLIIEDLATPDLESDEQCTPSTPSAPSAPSKLPKCTPTASIKGNGSGLSMRVNLATPLDEIQTSDEEENVFLEIVSAAAPSITAIEYSRAVRPHGRAIARVADWLRWIGKSLAIVNAIGIIANSVFDYAGVYETCYCNSNIYSWGSLAFYVINPNSSDIDLARSARIGSIALALTCCTSFVGTIYLIRDSLPS
ncbi:hypothetical protein J3R83DRAFT_3235 [Lanmaoa asiatica]|nr:hypothetical protein J3R83DRAFT_3235 [Lanmaoa asiatica]